MADKGCFKKGCFGCLGVIVLVVGVPLVLVAMGFVMGAPEKKQENQVLEQALPELPTAPEPAAEEDAGTPLDSTAQIGEPGAGELVPDYVERPLMPNFLGTPPAGRVELQLEMGDFIVEPGPPDEGLRVEAEYDTGTYELVERYEAADDGTWVYRVRFKSKVSWFRRLWGDNRVQNKVKLIVPRGRPMAVSGRVGMGQSRIELGGLWLTDVDLRLGTGDHELSFDEPVVEPLPRLRIESGVGEMKFRGIGNASPAETSIQSKVGDLRIDLRGDWRQDGTVDVDFSVGDCRVTLPDDVHVDVERAQVSVGERRMRNLEPSEPVPEGAPTVTLRVDSSVGDLRIEG
jgi:hypothetical protein